MSWTTQHRLGFRTVRGSSGAGAARCSVRIGQRSEGPVGVSIADGVVHALSAQVRNVTGVRGAVWVTVEADLADHVLRPGESVTIPKGRRAVAQGLGSGAYRVRT